MIRAQERCRLLKQAAAFRMLCTLADWVIAPGHVGISSWSSWSCCCCRSHSSSGTALTEILENRVKTA